MIARERARAELAAAMQVGSRVCRQMIVGVGVRDVIRGSVTRIDGERIAVRIDDPGVIDHMIGDTRVAKGASVTDALKNWLPCQ